MISSNNKFKHWSGSLVAVLLGLCSISAAHAQIFVTNYSGATVGEYNTDGTTVNDSLLTGLNNPFGIALTGSDLFVSNHGDGTNGTILDYNLLTATTTTFASGLAHLNGIAASGTNLYVPNFGTGTITDYNTGTGVGSTLVSGLSSPYNVTISGTDLFYTDYTNGNIGEYNLTTGTLNASLVSGLTNPFAVAASGSDLFVTTGDNTVLKCDLTTGEITTLLSNSSGFFGIAMLGSNLLVATGDNTILEYNTTTGLSSTLISGPGLQEPNDLLVAAPVVPEPSAWALMLGGLGLLIFWRIRRAGFDHAAKPAPAPSAARVAFRRSR